MLPFQYANGAYIRIAYPRKKVDKETGGKRREKKETAIFVRAVIGPIIRIDIDALRSKSLFLRLFFVPRLLVSTIIIIIIIVIISYPKYLFSPFRG